MHISQDRHLLVCGVGRLLCSLGEHPSLVALTLQSRGLPNPPGDTLDDMLCKYSQQRRTFGERDMAANIQVWSDNAIVPGFRQPATAVRNSSSTMGSA